MTDKEKAMDNDRYTDTFVKGGRMKRFAAMMLIACGLLWGQTGVWAQQGDPTTYTQQTFYEWFNKYKDAKP